MTPRYAEEQSTNTVVMITPRSFAYNPETGATNHFQVESSDPTQDVQALAAEEHKRLVKVLKAEGINVILVEDSREPVKPDAVFPNNWFSTHNDGSNGTMITYPMANENRRLERDLAADLVLILTWDYGFKLNKVVELDKLHEEQGEYLEGTGSMVLDRVNHIAYACISQRTSPSALQTFGNKADYEVVTFSAVDKDDRPIYHTNVMMAIGTEFAVICAESIKDETERENVIESLKATGHEIIEITFDQVNEFAGNCLELKSDKNGNILVMSSRARNALTPDQISAIEKHVRIVDTPIPTIENQGGGSVRCTLAEIHLPRP